MLVCIFLVLGIVVGAAYAVFHHYFSMLGSLESIPTLPGAEMPAPTAPAVPGPAETDALGQVQTERPEPAQAENPEQVQTETPEPTQTDSPEQQQTEDPEQVQTQSPEQPPDPTQEPEQEQPAAEPTLRDEAWELDEAIRKNLEARSAASDQYTSEAFNVLVIGLDSSSDSMAGNSDTILLISVNRQTKQMLFTSFLRDIYVSIPGWGNNRLDTAYAFGGAELLQQTMQANFGIPVDRCMVLNFYIVVDLIDALGGVTVHSDITFDTKNMKGYHFEKGENAVDGAAALAFARERYSYASGDRQRGENQMEVIRAVVKKAVSADILKNYSALLQEAEDCVDTNIPYPLIASLVRGQLFEGEDWEVSTYSVDGTGDRQVPYSMDSSVYVMVPDQETVRHARELLEQARQR